MIERNIDFDRVSDAINFPNYKVSRKNKFEVYRRFRNQMLKVVFVEENKFIKVVTVVWK